MKKGSTNLTIVSRITHFDPSFKLKLLKKAFKNG